MRRANRKRTRRSNLYEFILGEEFNMLKVGDKAPGFSLLSDSGKTISLSDFKGSTLVLYFFPKADTPG